MKQLMLREPEWDPAIKALEQLRLVSGRMSAGAEKEGEGAGGGSKAPSRAGPLG